jgi:two-component system OmpR family response regulator
MPEVLVADDDAALREVVAYALRRDGFAVVEAADGAAVLRQVALRAPDLVVLDVAMPEVDGLEACRRLRGAGSRVPILFLSTRSDEIDRVLGLELGGDDYLGKPFSPRELVSRVKAILRRAEPAPTEPSEIRAGGVRIRRDEHRAWVDAEELHLTATEMRLLIALAGRPGRVHTREALVEEAYGGPHHVAARTLDSHLRNLRAKLRDHGIDAIATVHGVGFRWDLVDTAPVAR